MHRLVSAYDTAVAAVERGGDAFLPVLARFVFAATLLVYFWSSAATKPGEGVFGFLRPSVSAHAQIFPRHVEAVGYDLAQLTPFHWLVVTAGTCAEFLLPALIVLGLATRLAALGMVGFVALQSLTDVYGHRLTDARTLGAWFDRAPDSMIMDQRLFWVFLLCFLVVRGAGALSLDGLLRHRLAAVSR